MQEYLKSLWVRFSFWIARSASSFWSDLCLFFSDLAVYVVRNLHVSFIRFENGKGLFVTTLYRKRGKYARRFTHSGMAGLAAVGIMIAPVVANEFPGTSVDPWEAPSPSSVLSVSTESLSTETQVSDKLRDKVLEYSVKDGDTIGTIAEKFGVSKETVLWQNDLTDKSKIKPGQIIEILPVSGIAHRVKKGDTIYSIAKKYDANTQPIVDFPFNTFTNDETFELAVGQIVIVPEGVRKSSGLKYIPRVRQTTPNAGTVVALGSFAWPTSGVITQNFAWYHTAIDVANRSAPKILAADSGTVIVAGWPDSWGYGNRVVIDHGNGYKTRYAHMASVYVSVGQTVNQGDAIGKMGSTGRSTGTHLHFEVIRNGVKLSPLSVLQ